MADFPITLPFIFGLSFADSSLTVTAAVSAGAGRGISGTLNTTVTFTADLALAGVAQADTTVVADTTVNAGWSVRGTPTIEVGLTAEAQLAALGDVNLDAQAAPTGLAGFGLTATTNVLAGVSADPQLHAVADAPLGVTVTPEVVFTYNADSGLAVTVDAGAVTVAEYPVEGSISVTAATTTQASLGSRFESNLGAITGLSGAARRAAFAQSSVQVSVTITAGLSRGQKVTAQTVVQAGTTAVQRRDCFATASLPIMAAAFDEAFTQSEFGGRLTATVGFTAAAVTNCLFAADLLVQTMLVGRGQLGGTPEDRITSVAAEIRITTAESRDGAFVVPAENRLVPAGEIEDVLVPSDLRSMRVEQRI